MKTFLGSSDFPAVRTSVDVPVVLDN